ncbi:hypothetical protein SRM_01364 [Salinibacter ruber M8]|uniref:Uncharacterized protein n=1 Tax=Salinibacter ruber (strain M8) TaxID=761659 RepID=D5H8D0_SALRM|nr:hypothetical protein SRM_01364 [Salinibacter ruber M8]
MHPLLRTAVSERKEPPEPGKPRERLAAGNACATRRGLSTDSGALSAARYEEVVLAPRTVDLRKAGTLHGLELRIERQGANVVADEAVPAGA